MSFTWDEVLDDLERRVAAAEAGDLATLEGWAPPAQPPAMTAGELRRATGVAARQQHLTTRLREQQAGVVAAMRATRKPAYRAVTAPPVYLDRLG